MTYQTKDESEESGAPVLLYEFIVGATTYRHTDRTTAATYPINGVAYTWEPAVIVPSKFGQANDIGKDTLELKIAKSSTLAAEFLDGVPDAVVSVTVFRAFLDEPAPLLYWSGSVANVDTDDEGLALNCVPIFGKLKTQGLRALCMSTCRHQLYDDWCALYKPDYETSNYAWEVQGDKVRISAFSARQGYWVGGSIKWGGVERTILSHSVGQQGDWLTLSRPIRALSVWLAAHPGQNTQVMLYRGCDHSYSACKGFGNKGRFGGFPWFRRRNPFTTSLVA